MRKTEEPVTSKGGVRGDEEVTTHPAFGQIGAYRTSGSTALYDSDFRHNQYMTIKISASELRRGLNRDWHFGKGEFVEVALSEAQWATFVSSPNMGSGVPCTIKFRDGEVVPNLPDPISRTDQFKGEMAERVAGMVAQVSAAIEQIDGMSLPKGKAQTIKDTLNSLQTNLRSNLPFVAESFDEHMEGTVEKAKQEVHGYMTGVLQRAGLNALANGSLPLAIEHKETPA